MREGGGRAGPAVDFAKLQDCTQKVMCDFSAAIAALACSIGDRLGLFDALVRIGEATSQQLASHTKTDEWCVREWLSPLAAAGYLHYDPPTSSFSLPPEQAELLANKGGMLSLGGGFELLLGLAKPTSQIIESFRDGAGVEQSAYGE